MWQIFSEQNYSGKGKSICISICKNQREKSSQRVRQFGCSNKEVNQVLNCITLWKIIYSKLAGSDWVSCCICSCKIATNDSPKDELWIYVQFL